MVDSPTIVNLYKMGAKTYDIILVLVWSTFDILLFIDIFQSHENLFGNLYEQNLRNNVNEGIKVYKDNVLTHYLNRYCLMKTMFIRVF